MTSYRMIVADIDGTLLDSASQLRPSVLRAITQARAAGLIFTVATGRRYVTAQRIIEDIGLTATMGNRCTSPACESVPVVLQAGAMVVSADGNTVLQLNPLPLGDSRTAVDVLVELGLQPILYEKRVHEQRLFTGPPAWDSPPASKYLAGNPALLVRQEYSMLRLHEQPLQIAVIGQKAPLEAAAPNLHLAGCRTIISYSTNLDSYFMEVFRSDVSKGSAVQYLATRLEVPLEEVVCVGDNWNDVEMLAIAGCGVVVENGLPGIAPYAQRIGLSNDQDAIAAIIADVLAGREPGRTNPEYSPRPN